MKHVSLLLTLMTLFLTIEGRGHCTTLNTPEPVVAVQEKIFHKHHDLALVTGYIPGDSFYHVIPVGLSYTYNFNDHFSWEVARIYYNLTTEKDLLTDLSEDFGATPERFIKPEMQILSHLVLRPFYGKDSVWNKWILNHETYFYGGGGMDFYENNFDSDALEKPENKQSPCLSFGAGIKYFTTEKTYIAFEVRDYLTFRNDEAENSLWFGINAGFRFNLRSRNPYASNTAKRLNGYLKD